MSPSSTFFIDIIASNTRFARRQRAVSAQGVI